MKITLDRVRGKFIITVLAATTLTGCASFDIKESVALTNEEASAFTGGSLSLIHI